MKQSINTTLHQPSVKKILQLHPKLRDEAMCILKDIVGVLTSRAWFIVTSTYRSTDEQQRLYNIGRTTPGRIVTNARPGHSYHNYGLALDGALLIDGKTISWDFEKDWDNDRRADWFEVVQVFKEYGWEWGGDWKNFKDRPHFQKTFGKKITDLLQANSTGQFDNEGFVWI